MSNESRKNKKIHRNNYVKRNNKRYSNFPAVTNEIEELERKASAHDEVLKITADYTVGKIDAQQSIIKIADLLDAWVV